LKIPMFFPEEAMKAALWAEPDLILLDIIMPGKDGMGWTF
jgi:CheY-like chemotaxis protein